MRLELGGSLPLGNKIMKASSTNASGPAYLKLDLGSSHSEIWVSFRTRLSLDSLKELVLNGWSRDLVNLRTSSNVEVSKVMVNDNHNVALAEWQLVDATMVELSFDILHVHPDKWTQIGLHYHDTVLHDLYVDGKLGAHYPVYNIGSIRNVYLGQYGSATYNFNSFYFDDLEIGSTKGANDLFSDDFDGADLSSWTDRLGMISQILDPFYEHA
jgi:hypothetical protein